MTLVGSILSASGLIELTKFDCRKAIPILLEIERCAAEGTVWPLTEAWGCKECVWFTGRFSSDLTWSVGFQKRCMCAYYACRLIERL